MLRYLGYVAIALSIDATTNRTCRLRNATPARLRQIIQSNLRDLYRVLQFNRQNSIFLYRISSQVIPFASHPVNRIPWWDEYSELFAKMADFIARNRMRVSMHPGHFTVLNSPNPQIVAVSIRELRWHVKFLERLRTDRASKIVIHIGGAYGDKDRAADRFVSVVNRLEESLRGRLILENDERAFTVEDVLNVAQRSGLPVVFDWLHHNANPGRDQDISKLLAECFNTWSAADGLPKVHFSSQAINGRVGRHADWVNADEFEAFLRIAPKDDFDCMLEAKCKDLALFRLRRDLNQRGILERPAA